MCIFVFITMYMIIEFSNTTLGSLSHQYTNTMTSNKELDSIREFKIELLMKCSAIPRTQPADMLFFLIAYSTLNVSF